MTQNEYNLSLILFFIIIILGNFFLSSILIKEGKTLKCLKKSFSVYKGVVISLAIIVALVLFVFSTASISFGVEKTETVRVIDIIQNGSHAGKMDYYSLYVRNSNGECFWVSSPLFADENLNEQLSELEISDTITIAYVKNTQVVYRIEE